MGHSSSGLSNFVGIRTQLQQGGNEVVLDHAHCASYLTGLTADMAEGFMLRMNYWKANAHSPIHPIEDGAVCGGDNAGDATISNISIRASELHLPCVDIHTPEIQVTPRWSSLFATIAIVESLLLGAGGIAAWYWRSYLAGADMSNVFGSPDSKWTLPTRTAFSSMKLLGETDSSIDASSPTAVHRLSGQSPRYDDATPPAAKVRK